MPGLGGRPRHPRFVHDIGDPGFGLGAQVQMILQQLTEQLSGIDLQPLLQLTMAQGAGLLAFQPDQHGLEPVPRAVERGGLRSVGCRRRHAQPRRCCRRAVI